MWGGNQNFQIMMGTPQITKLPDRTQQAEQSVRNETLTVVGKQPTLDEKVEFLGTPSSYPQPIASVIRRETHMSWVFLAGDKVYKLKKPVRFPYLGLLNAGTARGRLPG